jgi:hypothetical protein
MNNTRGFASPKGYYTRAGSSDAIGAEFMPGMLGYLKFKFCPCCGEPCLQPNDLKSFTCLSCGLVYYYGTSAVVSGIVEWQDRIIFIRRANEPHKNE